MLYSVLAAALLLGQQTPAPNAEVANPGEAPKRGRIAGKAVNAVTNEPIRKANLQLSAAQMNRQGIAAVSDAEGNFVFENVEAGSYRLAGERAGYVRSTYGTRSAMGMGGMIQVGAGQEVKDIVFKMTPAAVISGRILDEDGEPVEGAQVSPLRRMNMNGSMRWSMAGNSVPTNDRGEFRLSSLPPGAVRLLVQLNRFGPGGATPTTVGKEEMAYTRTYFPGVESVDQAQSILLTPGQEYSGVQMALKRVRVFRVRGKYTGPLSDAATGRLNVQIREKTPDPMSMFFGGGNMVNPKDGTFEVAGVRPGAYKLMVMDLSKGRPQPAGATEVVVGNDHVEGVVVAPQAPATVSGKVTVELDPQAQPNAPTPSLKDFRVQLMPVEMTGMMFAMPATVGEDGSFQMEGISPDTYRVVVMGPMFNTYTKSIMSGGRDIKDGTLEVSGGSMQLEITMSTKVAKLSGTVEKANEAAMAGVVVLEKVGVVVGFAAGQPMLSVSQTGSFAGNSVAPGEYRLYAFEEVDFTQARDAEFLKKFASQATTVKLSEGESKSVSLRQIPASAVEAVTKEN
ncbi:carboxypeptidase regulatory-like domain-containing protein [Nostoc sp. NIES-2111]